MIWSLMSPWLTLGNIEKDEGKIGLKIHRPWENDLDS